jgi:hypothetical protein
MACSGQPKWRVFRKGAEFDRHFVGGIGGVFGQKTGLPEASQKSGFEKWKIGHFREKVGKRGPGWAQI